MAMYQCVILLEFTILLVAARNEIRTFHCQLDNNCDVGGGQECQRFFQSCEMGECLCDMNSYTEASFRQCLKLGGLECSEMERCADGMRCSDGRCKCKLDRERMTDDRTYCLLPHQRLLGENCDSNTRCLRKNAGSYTEQDTVCSRSHCDCAEGFKRDALRCVHRNLNEFGCIHHDHCTGGALCKGNRCVCPEGYIASDSGTRCIKSNAIRGLREGEFCDEINGDRYCSPGLTCHRCGNDIHYRCHRHLRSSPYHLYSSGSSFSRSKSTSVFPAVLLTFLLILPLG